MQEQLGLLEILGLEPGSGVKTQLEHSARVSGFALLMHFSLPENYCAPISLSGCGSLRSKSKEGKYLTDGQCPQSDLSCSMQMSWWAMGQPL